MTNTAVPVCDREAPTSGRDRGVIRRVGATVVATGFLIASLLTFPGGVAWMAGGWILAHTWLVTRGKPGWVPLAVCLAMLLAKRVYWPPSLYVLAVVILVAAAISSLAAPVAARGLGVLVRRSVVVFLWGVWSWFACEVQADSHCRRPLVLDKARPVACIGDSLTSGVPPYGGYPDVLAPRLAVPVINLGQAGITAEQALSLLPALRRARPQAVVIELGGHDYLRGRSRSETRAVLERIIHILRDADVEIVLFEIPRGFVTDPYAGLERELARRYSLELISDAAIRQLVLFSPYAPPGLWMKDGHLSDDGLHPNSQGNLHLADQAARALGRMYGPEILLP